MHANDILLKYPSENQGAHYLKAKFQCLSFPVIKDADEHRDDTRIGINQHHIH